MSGTDKDPLLRAASAVAEGEQVNWESELEATPSQSSTLNNLRRLAAISDVMRSVAEGEFRDTRSPDQLEQWGHLKLLEELGRGSFGTVYRAFDPTLQRDVAVKLRRSDTHSITPQAWIDEARRLARIRHPNVLAVHGANTHDGIAGLWSDLMLGQTLEQAIKVDGQFSVPRALDVALQLAAALAAVHNAGLVHGDLKPANVMLENDNHVVLMDFGAGSKISSEQSSQSARIGSPLVMAPEQFDGSHASPATDVYAFGVLIYRMLSASYPVKAKSLKDLQEKHQRGERVSVTQRRKGLPAALVRLIEAMTDASPARRPTLAQIIAQLNRIQSQPRRRRRYFAVASLFALLAVGLGITLDALLRAKQAESEAKAVNDFLLEILAAPRGFEQGSEVKVVDVLEQAADRVRGEFSAEPELRSRLLFIVGRTFESLRDYYRAEPLLSEVIEIRRPLLGVADHRVLHSLALLGEIQLETARYQQAHVTADEMLQTATTHLSEGHRYHVQALTLKGSIHTRLEEFEQAEQVLREAVALRQGPQWRDDYNGNLARLHLASLLNSSGQFAEAEKWARQSLDFSLRMNGERNTNTFAARHNLIIALNQLGRYREAEPHSLKNYEATRAWLGADAYPVGTAASDLSNTLYHLGKPREALEMDKIAMSITQKTYGPDHLNTLSLQANIANRYKEIGDILAAESSYRQVIQVATEEFGESHSLVLMTRYNLSELYYETARYSEAYDMARATHEVMTGALGNDHLFTLVTESMIGATLSKLGQHKQAQEQLRNTLARCQQAIGKDNDYTLDTAMYLAEDLAVTGGLVEARTIALDVMQRRIRMLGPDHPKTQQTQEFVALLSKELQPSTPPSN